MLGKLRKGVDSAPIQTVRISVQRLPDGTIQVCGQDADSSYCRRFSKREDPQTYRTLHFLMTDAGGWKQSQVTPRAA